MGNSQLLTHDPPLRQAVVPGIDLLVSASQRQALRLVAQVLAHYEKPFHTGRVDLLNPRACDLWAREAHTALAGMRGADPSVCVDHFKRALQMLSTELQAVHVQAASRRLAAADEQPPYIVREGRICRLHGGRIEPLCNFTATIVTEVLIDDGALERGELTIDGTLDDGEHLAVVRVPIAQFARMDWVLLQWGTRARLAAGAGVKDQLREAIQWLSPRVARSRLFGHCGWRKLGDCWYWLHAGGAVGASAPCKQSLAEETVQVRLACNLERVRLPDPPTGRDLITAIRASLAVLAVAPDSVSIPLLAATYRAPLAEVLPVDVSLYLSGQSGAGKSELSALAQAHFGSGFTRLTLPAQWSSTANALERLAFEAKDCLLVIDDFAPRGSPLEVTRLHALADRVFRGAGNHAGRSRMAVDGTLQPDFPPRGLVLASGEDIPAGQSLAARLLVIQVTPSTVRGRVLDVAQRSSREGLFAGAMAGYLSWLAPRLDMLRSCLHDRNAELRRQVVRGQMHPLTPDAVASLLIGWEQWLQYAREAGAITEDEAATLWRRGWSALVAVGVAQSAQAVTQAPAQQFATLLSAALASQRAHLTTLDGTRPVTPGRWGWRPVQQAVTDGTGQGTTERLSWAIAPGSRHIGWITPDGQLYLQPDSAYAAAQHLAAEKRESVPVAEKTLWKRLHEAGMLASVDSADGKHLLRRTIGGQRQYVLHIHTSVLGDGDSGVWGAHGAAVLAPAEGSCPTIPDLR
jgi:hypothetical protein